MSRNSSTGCSELCGGVQRVAGGEGGNATSCVHTIGSHDIFTPHNFAPAGNMMGAFGDEVTTPDEAKKNQQLAPAGEGGFKLCEGMEGL